MRATARESQGFDAYHHVILDLTPEPYRSQLDKRWSSCLLTHAGEYDHAGWMDHFLANYRDEIVYFGPRTCSSPV